MKVVDAVELSLGANALLSDIHRLHWKTKTAGAGAKTVFVCEAIRLCLCVRL